MKSEVEVGVAERKEKKPCCLVTVDRYMLFSASEKEMSYSLCHFWVDAVSAGLYMSCTLSAIIITTVRASHFEELTPPWAWYTLPSPWGCKESRIRLRH